MTRNPLSRLDLNALVLFNALIDTGQLTEAAKRIGITQSAASQALGRLRRIFGDELFVRTRTGMRATPRALSLAPAVRESLLILEQTLRESSSFDPVVNDRLFKIAFGPVGEASFLPRLLSQFDFGSSNLRIHSAHPDVEEAIEFARRAEVDLFLDFTIPQDKNLHHQKLLDDELVVIARRNHPRIRRSMTIEDYFAEKHVVVMTKGQRRQLIQRVFSYLGKQREVAVEVQHTTSIPGAVVNSDLIALVPRTVIDNKIYEKSLRILPAPVPIGTLSLYMIWHRAFDQDPGHRWLRELVGRSFTESSANSKNA